MLTVYDSLFNTLEMTVVLIRIVFQRFTTYSLMSTLNDSSEKLIKAILFKLKTSQKIVVDKPTEFLLFYLFSKEVTVELMSQRNIN